MNFSTYTHKELIAIATDENLSKHHQVAQEELERRAQSAKQMIEERKADK